jgi:hypothetical protein
MLGAFAARVAFIDLRLVGIGILLIVLGGLFGAWATGAFDE